jgi:hypothetical protein
VSEPEFNTLNPLAVSSGVGASSVDSRINNIPDPFSDFQYGIERLNSAREGRANPPFAITSYANRLAEGQGNIVRGYIRRSDVDPGDVTSNYRLYFMYNPESIQRNYMAYLDQQSLDPYNTLFGSSNSPAPPGILDFSFELLFDRHLEVSSDPTHEGIKVDYRFFDIVVRGVVPDVPTGGNAIPDDNGIIMLNPKNVAVVFGPELVVHGRPYNASVRFEKFNHRMVPTRMTVGITMKVFYIGPVQTVPDFETTPSTAIYSATIPYNESIKYNIDYEEVAKVEAENNDGDTTGSFGGFGGIVDRIIQGSVFYRAGVTLTEGEMADLVMASGLRGEAAAFAVAIANKESGFKSDNYNTDSSTLDDSWGLFQINYYPGANREEDVGTRQQQTIPAHAMRTFLKLSNNGTNFAPWRVNNEGIMYQVDKTGRIIRYTGVMPFLDRARVLIRERGGY